MGHVVQRVVAPLPTISPLGSGHRSAEQSEALRRNKVLPGGRNSDTFQVEVLMLHSNS